MKIKIDKFLLVLLFISLGLNLYLGWRVKRDKIAPTAAQVTQRLSAGVEIQQVRATTLDGKQETISFAGSQKPTVFYVLSPSCVWCERNNENINAIAKEKADNFRFIGLSLANQNLSGYLQSHRFTFPVYANVAPESIAMLGLGVTPQTIIVGPDGRVIKNWVGAYSSSIQPQVEEFFGVRLPGLDPSKQNGTE